jgi:hypothetical protein
MFAAPIYLVGRLKHRYKQKTPPIVAGQWMRGRVLWWFFPHLRLPVI